ncbi:ras-related protein Rap-2a-like [Gopherus evgoodei]|uniref:Ras-related protein Rap-2a-like n=1 Tax=Gopherus evgoodei TaxID=1825980 RepID=A0A8C4Y6G1_9SAUR|nr:ras-related protein Rap-2a-like [Gopherus evgoodei]
MALCPAPEARVRLVFFGAAGVGKTALIRRFLQDSFEARHRRTVEELHLLELELELGAGSGLRLRLEILDTSGSYSFPAMRRLCIGRADAFALVYSLQEPDSFAEVQRLRDEILEAKRGAVPVVVVGNKSDLAPGEPDPRIAAAQRDWGCTCLEASAKQGRNVVGLFQELLSQVNLPGRLSPALQRRQPQTCSKEPPRRSSKSHGCAVC